MDDNKKLTSAEQREKLKEEFKKELMFREKIKKQVQNANTMNKIHNNLDKILQLAKISPDMDLFIEQLNEKAAINEAKLDLSLEELKSEFFSEKTVEVNSNPEVEVLDTKTVGNEEKNSEQIIQNDITSNHDTKTLGDDIR